MLLWGVGTRTGQVPNGRREERRCPACEKVTRFWEANMTDTLNVFFVELGGVRQRRMVCEECGHDEPMAVAPNEQAAPAPAPRASAPTPPRPRPSERELDDALRALKKKMQG